MEKRAQGTFDVTLTPQSVEDLTSGTPIGCLSNSKQFYGDLDATSKGVMLAVRSSVEGSAGYVLIEQVTGTLAGRSGSFVLQHNGLMDRQVPQLTITVVPDTGTEQLEGLRGALTIEITDGNHSYNLTYSLPELT